MFQNSRAIIWLSRSKLSRLKRRQMSMVNVDFSSDVSEQSGNYLALKIEAEPAEAKTVVELVGGTKGPVTLDEDMNIVLLIKNKDTQSIKVTTTHNEESITKTYGLSGLTLETE
nr:MAG TPA: hypothetical protein [Caudoviricetes sp.]